MDIQSGYRSYVKKATRKYPATIKFYTEKLINEKFKGRQCFIYEDEIKETANNIIEDLPGLKNLIDKQWQRSDNDSLKFHYDIGIVEGEIMQEIENIIETQFKVEKDMNNGGIYITKE